MRDMDSRLQKRIQRYGWDRAAQDYEALWQAQLADAHTCSMELAALAPGERVLDIACGTGLVTFAAARAVGAAGRVVGVYLSGLMVEEAQRRSRELTLAGIDFARMDAQALAFPDRSFDAALCALGLMYVPDPLLAVLEMKRCVRPGGRIVLTVWGDRSQCGWAPIFPIVDAEVSSEVCPLFFNLGAADVLLGLCVDAGLDRLQQRRITTTLRYGNGDEACNAAFVGGPVALAWSRFDIKVRTRVAARYLQAIETWRRDGGYELPGEFVVVSAVVPD
jgi:ubiquinone/menaquinone biosynthesis C-methylase UbiE